MSYTALENVPITVDLTQSANYTGWDLPGGGIARHSSCQSGFITLTLYPVIAHHTYIVTYTILTLPGAYIQTFAGGTAGAQYNSPEIVVETITATVNGFVQLYASFVNATVQLLNVKDITVVDPVTIVFARKNNKWSDWRTLYPEFGMSIFEVNVVTSQGSVYVQQNGSNSRNNFFGVQYQSFFSVVGNSKPTEVKKFKSISYQANELLITSPDGITTSLGQVSELIDEDFLKTTLADTSGTVSIYTNEGVYSAQFLNDKNTNLLNGDPLKGNWIVIELTTFHGSVPVQLYTVGINDKLSHIGVR